MKKTVLISIMLLFPTILLAQYSVILKNGKVLHSRVKPVMIFGHVLYTDPDGMNFDLNYQDVDLEKTRAANKKVKKEETAKITEDELRKRKGKVTLPIAGEEILEEGTETTASTGTEREPSREAIPAGQRFIRESRR